MISTYMNSTSVTEQVNNIKTRKNLLLWYTGDEPDGTSDPLDAPLQAYELIKSLDVYSDVLRKAGRDKEAVEAKKEAKKLRDEYEKSRVQVVPSGDTVTQATE